MDFNKELMERIWKHIDKNENGCWLSELSVNRDGYSKIWINKASRPFHRVMLFWSDQTKVEQFNSSVNNKACYWKACHNCPNNNKNCVNPAHLYWGTADDNMKDRIKDGTNCAGEKNVTSKLTEQQVLEIREKYAKGDITHKVLAQEYGVVYGNISMILTRKTWKHI